MHRPGNLLILSLALALASLGLPGRGQDDAPSPSDATPADTAPASPPPAVADPAADLATDAPSDSTVTPAESSDAVPTAYPEERYVASWDKNPFLLKTAVVAQKTESFAKDWALSGISATKGIYTVRIFNKQTNKFERLREGESNSEFRLVSVHYNKDRTQSMVKVARGSEVAELKFDDSLLSRPVTVANTQGNAGAAPGQPAQPGAPAMPGTPLGTPGAPVPGTPAQPQGNPRMLPNTGRPGQPVHAAPAMGNPAMGAPVNPAAPGISAPPPVSRRRQLIPAPIQQAQ